MDFSQLGLNETVLDGLEAMGFNKPTPIQEQSIPFILEGKDLIACAQTGTGKTAAYLLPLLHQLSNKHAKNTKAIILAPTRELALQIDQQLEGFSYFIPVSSAPVYGGGDGITYEQQKTALQSGCEIIVATPGRLISHLAFGYVDLSEVEYLILDEADRMLDMGFLEDIMKIVDKLPLKRQSLLFSATMPPKIRGLAKKLLQDPEQINISMSKPAEGVLQAAYLTYDTQKIPLVSSILKDRDLPSVIIFTSRKSSVKEIARALQRINLGAAGISSDLEQNEREQVLLDFRNRKNQILVATDILSRGIDIENISMVINYDVPQDAEDYVHRVGRTARAETTGIALTFINENDMFKFHRIEELIGYPVRKEPLPVELGPGPEWNTKKRMDGNRFKGKGKSHNPRGGKSSHHTRKDKPNN